MRNTDSFFFVFSILALFLITGCHQDRVVDGCAELDGSDDDACYERKAGSLIIWDCHVQHDRKFDHGYQDNRQGNRFEDQQDDDKDCTDGKDVYVDQIGVGDILQVFHQRCFTDDHTIFIVRFYNLVNLFDLFVYFIRCRLIFRADECKLVIITLQHASKILRDHGFRNGRAEQGAHADG